jgi:hypothetical protein
MAVEMATNVRVEIVGVVEEDEKGQALLCELLAVLKGDFAHHGPVQGWAQADGGHGGRGLVAGAPVSGPALSQLSVVRTRVVERQGGGTYVHSFAAQCCNVSVSVKLPS